MTTFPIHERACHLELSGLTHPSEHCKGCGYACGQHRNWKHRAKTWPETVATDADESLMLRQWRTEDEHEAERKASALRSAHEPIPDDIRATIIDMIDHIAQGSTSALFSRLHDVRKWVGER